MIEVRAYLVLDIGLVGGDSGLCFPEINSIKGETVEDKRGRKPMRKKNMETGGGGSIEVWMVLITGELIPYISTSPAQRQ